MPLNVKSTCSGRSQDPASVRDVEKPAQPVGEKLDIEHVRVDDDPRKWSNMRKVSNPSITVGIFYNLFSRRAYWP